MLNVYCALLYCWFELCIPHYCIVYTLPHAWCRYVHSIALSFPSFIWAAISAEHSHSYLCRPFATFLAAPLPSSSAVYFLLSAITLLLEAIKDESSPHQAGNSRSAVSMQVSSWRSMQTLPVVLISQLALTVIIVEPPRLHRCAAECCLMSWLRRTKKQTATFAEWNKLYPGGIFNRVNQYFMRHHEIVLGDTQC